MNAKTILKPVPGLMAVRTLGRWIPGKRKKKKKGRIAGTMVDIALIGAVSSQVNAL